jgi:hypothetical protein
LALKEKEVKKIKAHPLVGLEKRQKNKNPALVGLQKVVKNKNPAPHWPQKKKRKKPIPSWASKKKGNKKALKDFAEYMIREHT